MAEPGDRLGGRYELLEPIGSGGMAVVWRARDTRLRRTVAVKVLRPQFAEDAEFVQRFESEARHAASLGHQNVAAVYDTGFDPGPDGGDRYIVMEFVDGPTVAERLNVGPLPAALAVDIAIAAARALAAAHRRGVVHRDVKPGNLLIGPDGRVRLADFGIARALTSSRLTTAGTLFGSARYMSPEQSRGEEALAPSDIYSLGLVLFEMLHGRLPDPPGAAPTNDPPAVPAGSSSPDLPAGLGAILSRALQADPERRYPSARAFADALEAAARRLEQSAMVPRRGVRAADLAARTRQVTGARRRTALLVAPSGPTAPAVIGETATSMWDQSTTIAVAPSRHAWVTGRASAQDERRRRLRVGAGVGLLAGATIVAVAFVTTGIRSLGGVLAATSTPGAVAVASERAPASLTVSVVPSPGSAQASPTTLATPRPSTTPRPPTPPLAGGPAAAVEDFYDAVESHNWDRAVALWSEGMQERYPPDGYLIGRFSNSTTIDITRLRQTALNAAAGTARVAVTIVEYRTIAPSPRTFVGSWDLIRVDGRWLLDDPDF